MNSKYMIVVNNEHLTASSQTFGSFRFWLSDFQVMCWEDDITSGGSLSEYYQLQLNM